MILMLTFSISSTSVGSISHASRYAQVPVPAYKISKTALNMLTMQYALEYDKEGFTVLAISPGVCTLLHYFL